MQGVPAKMLHGYTVVASALHIAAAGGSMDTADDEEDCDVDIDVHCPEDKSFAAGDAGKSGTLARGLCTSTRLPM